MIYPLQAYHGGHLTPRWANYPIVLSEACYQ